LKLYSIKDNIFNVRNISDLNEIKQKINKYEYVSFDVFDTLVKRQIPTLESFYKVLIEIYNKKSFQRK